MKLLKQLRCKHQNQECMTNFYGDFIDVVSTHKKIIRSAWRCKDCGKVIYKEILGEDCKVINWDLYHKHKGD